MRNQLLQNVFYGTEIERAEAGTADLRDLLEQLGGLDGWASLRPQIEAFFVKPHPGVFGGQITLGDGYFIAALMLHVMPTRMLEFGVASGYSSALIVEMADRLGLLGRLPGPYLTSFDLMRVTANGQTVGSLFAAQYPHHLPYWRLHVETTSLDLLRDDCLMPEISGGPVLAFVDAGHAHPWPLTDIVALRRRLPPGSWIVLQDFHMMERWLADCVEYGVQSPPPLRGVNLAVVHYPGTKVIGTGICYNCAAIKLDIDDSQFEAYIDACLRYRLECTFEHLEEVVAATRATS